MANNLFKIGLFIVIPIAVLVALRLLPFMLFLFIGYLYGIKKADLAVSKFMQAASLPPKQQQIESIYQIPSGKSSNNSAFNAAFDKLFDIIIFKYIQPWYLLVSPDYDDQFSRVVKLELSSIVEHYPRLNLKQLSYRTTQTVHLFSQLVSEFLTIMDAFNDNTSFLEFSRLNSFKSVNNRAKRIQLFRRIAHRISKLLKFTSCHKIDLAHTIVREVIGNNVLENISEYFSDPHSLNLLIISALQVVETPPEPVSINLKPLEPSAYELERVLTGQIANNGHNFKLTIIELNHLSYDDKAYKLYTSIQLLDGGIDESRKVPAWQNPIIGHSLILPPEVQGLNIFIFEQHLHGNKTIAEFQILKHHFDNHFNQHFWIEEFSGNGAMCLSIVKTADKVILSSKKTAILEPSLTTIGKKKHLDKYLNKSTLHETLQSNDGFMSFSKYLERTQCPPYLKFYTAVQSHKQLSAKTQLQKNAASIFNNYFIKDSKYYITIPKAILNEVKHNIKDAPSAEVFKPILDYVLVQLEHHFQDYHNKRSTSFAPALPVYKSESMDSNLSQKEDLKKLSLAMERVDGPLEDDNIDALVKTLVDLRNQSMAIEESLAEHAADPKKTKLLLNRKKDINSQINALEVMVKDGLHMTTSSMDISLRGTVIKIIDQYQDNTSANPILAITNPLKISTDSNLVFVMQVQQKESTTGGWIISKTLNDFNNFHKLLSSKHEKVSKMRFPQRKIGYLWTGDDEGIKLSRELESYLTLLLTDIILIDSEEIKQFLAPTEKKTTQTLLGTVKKMLLIPNKLENVENTPKEEKMNVYDLLQQKRHSLIESLSNNEVKEEEIQREDLLIIIESIFAIIDEILKNDSSTMWLQKQLTGVLKTIARTQLSTIYEYYLEFLNNTMTEAKIKEIVEGLQGVLFEAGNGQAASEDEKKAAKELANQLLLNIHVPDAYLTLIGKYQMVYGLQKCFDALQNRDCNRYLIINVFDLISRCWIE